MASSTPATSKVEAWSTPGQVAFEIVDAASGRLMPGKLTFTGIHPSRDPRFSGSDLGTLIDGGIAAFDRVFSSTGKGSIRVIPGRYEVMASRGIEWGIAVQRIDVREVGASIRLAVTREITTPGWISGDFHVHANPSNDSIVPIKARLHEFASEGVEVLVATDHNRITDYRPAIASLGLEKILASIPGDEVTTPDWGHFGAFPLAPVGNSERSKKTNPFFMDDDSSPEGIFRDVRTRDPSCILDIHHPRSRDGMGYFWAGEYDAKKDTNKRRGFSTDFDAVEVLNGFQDGDRYALELAFRDWMQLLLHGHMATATGNSDTHHLWTSLAGYPRNFVYVGEDDVAKFDPQALTDGIREHRAFFTNGPFVDLRVDEVGIGGVVKTIPANKRFTAHLEVRVASWIPVDSATLWIDGQQAADFDIDPADARTLRLSVDHTFTAEKDAFIVARVDGAAPITRVIGNKERAHPKPLAVTNPVFIDVDGDGSYTPPLAKK